MGFALAREPLKRVLRTTMNMNRYLVFYGDDYYPCGGIHDFVGDFASLEECKAAIIRSHLKFRPDDTEWEWAWNHIWDSLKKETIVIPKINLKP
jgi:hypothetical protein